MKHTKQIKPMTVSDLMLTRDKTGISMIDIVFLNGQPLKERIKEENSEDKISNITLSVMLRAIQKEEKAIPFDIVNEEDVLEIIKTYQPDVKAGQYSIYFGLGYWPAQDWRRGVSSPSSRVKKVFMMIKRLTDLFGQEGWNIWIEALQEEAISRGTTFDNVIKTGTWTPKNDVKTKA